jgi:hypothetical protein
MAPCPAVEPLNVAEQYNGPRILFWSHAEEASDNPRRRSEPTQEVGDEWAGRGVG